MKIFFKRYVLIPFFVLMTQQVVKAEEQASQGSLILSQAQAVLLEDLDNERGRGGVDLTSLSKSNVGATLRNNYAIDTNTGYNYVGKDSITGNSGITDVVQNSGNNVIIQNSTTINVTIVP